MSEQEITEAGQADGVNLAEPVPGELSPPPRAATGSVESRTSCRARPP